MSDATPGNQPNPDELSNEMPPGFFFDEYIDEDLGALRHVKIDGKVLDECSWDRAVEHARRIIAPAVEQIQTQLDQALADLVMARSAAKAATEMAHQFQVAAQKACDREREWRGEAADRRFTPTPFDK